MTRRIFCKVLLVVVAVFGLLVLSGVLSAQGNRDWAFDRVKEVQERNTDRLMAMNGVEGTAIGYNQNDQLAVKVFTAGPGVRGIPQELDGVPVQVVVTGKFYALAPSGIRGKPPKDPTPPAPPTNLTATAVSSSQINLIWTANTEDDLSYYRVYRSDTGEADSYSRIASRVRSSAYSDTGLAAGTTYYYVVTAVDRSKNESADSEKASATTQAEGPPDVEPPEAPTVLKATAISSSEIDLDWKDNTEEDLSHYKVYRSTTSGSYGAPIASVDKLDSSYSDTGLAAKTTYYYVVTVVDTSDNKSTNSNEASDTTQAGPVEPPIGPRPAPIGVSTGHPNITAGTIGCRVKDAKGNVYALSNNHVYADENKASIGDNVLQPGPYDGGENPRDAIGTLADFEPIVFSTSASNTIDAAIALSSTANLGNATPDDGYGTPNSTTAEVYVNQRVQKYGRTTGLTSGRIAGVNATVNVGYDSGTARFVSQIVIRGGGFSAGGDSGSLIVTQSGNNPVGLLFAGSSSMTVANPIDAVLSRFGVTVDGQ